MFGLSPHAASRGASGSAYARILTQHILQSLELVAEMRILAEMKIKNHRRKSTSILFSMKIKMMDLCMQIDTTKLIFVILVC